MGVLEFADGLVGHLAWPVVALVLCLLFRGSIGELLGRIKSASAAGIELNFADKWNEAVADAIPGAVARDREPMSTSEDIAARHPETAAEYNERIYDWHIDRNEYPSRKAQEYPGRSPRAPRPSELDGHFVDTVPSQVIAVAYGRLVQAFAELLESHGLPVATVGMRYHVASDVNSLAGLAFEHTLISSEMIESVRALGRLYSLAKEYSDRITGDQAVTFLELVDGVLGRIWAAREEATRNGKRSNRPSSSYDYGGAESDAADPSIYHEDRGPSSRPDPPEPDEERDAIPPPPAP